MIGIAPNARLKRLGEPVLVEARAQQAAGAAETVRHFGEAE
jgi:hypothetical protein